MRRRLLSLAMAFVFLVGAVGIDLTRDARPAGATSASVTFKVDKDAKTITVYAHIAILMATAPRLEDLHFFTTDIERQIINAWNGHMFKCFQVIFKPDVVVRTAYAQVLSDEVPIGLDSSTVDLRSSVQVGYHDAAARNADSYLSDEPNGGLDANSGPSGTISTWAYPGRPNEYAHEFGHILGLDDNYVEGTWVTKPGAAPDLMWNLDAPVTPETIAKVIRRSGQVDESQLTCPATLEMAKDTLGLTQVIGGVSITLGFHAWVCDVPAPSSDPAHRGDTMTVHGMLYEGGAGNFGPFGAPKGARTSTFTVTVPVPHSYGDPVLLRIPVPATKPTELITRVRLLNNGSLLPLFPGIGSSGGQPQLFFDHVVKATPGASECG